MGAVYCFAYAAVTFDLCVACFELRVTYELR